MMNALPCPADRIVSIHKRIGMLFGPITYFKIGTPQRTIMECAGMLFVWLGRVDHNGYYFYTNCRKVSSLNFC